MRKKFLGQFDNNGISNWKVTRVPGTWQRGAKFELYKRDGIFVVNVFSCWCSSSLFLIKHTKRNQQFLKNEQTMSPYTVPYIVTREFNSVFRLFVFLFFFPPLFFFSFTWNERKEGKKTQMNTKLEKHSGYSICWMIVNTFLLRGKQKKRVRWNF